MKLFLASITLCLAIVTLVAGKCSFPKANQDTFDKLNKCTCSEDGNKIRTLTCQNMSEEEWSRNMTLLSGYDWKFKELILDSVQLQKGDQNPWSTFSFFHSLKGLTLSHCGISFNKLQYMYSTIDRLENLKIIIDYNETTLSKVIFQGNKDYLKQFSFTGGKINSIDSAIQTFAPNLQVLELDNNDFTQFPTEALKNLTRLTTISFIGNSINSISNDTVKKLEKYFPKLQKLGLDDIKCECDTFYSNLKAWVAKKRLRSVQCGSPDELQGQNINVISQKTYCESGSGSQEAAVSSMAMTFIFALFSFLNK